MQYQDIKEAVCLLLGSKVTPAIIMDVYYEVVIRRVETHGGFAATVAKAARLAGSIP